jgi:hypothetical protein
MPWTPYLVKALVGTLYPMIVRRASSLSGVGVLGWAEGNNRYRSLRGGKVSSSEDIFCECCLSAGSLGVRQRSSRPQGSPERRRRP